MAARKSASKVGARVASSAREKSREEKKRSGSQGREKIWYSYSQTGHAPLTVTSCTWTLRDASRLRFAIFPPPLVRPLRQDAGTEPRAAPFPLGKCLGPSAAWIVTSIGIETDLSRSPPGARCASNQEKITSKIPLGINVAVLGYYSDPVYIGRLSIV